jgi:nucleoid-associated protein YgaU
MGPTACRLWRWPPLGARLANLEDKELGLPSFAVWIAVALVAATAAVVAWRSARPAAGPPPSAIVQPAVPANPPLPAKNPEIATAPTPAAPTPATPPAAAPPFAPAPAPPVDSALPQFDVVRVGPQGDAVVAGRAVPDAKIDLLDRGQAIDGAMADRAGQFAILPKALTPGDHILSLRMTPKGGTGVDSTQNVVVVVPESRKDEVLVALAQPGEPTRILSEAAKAVPDVPAPAPAELTIRSVEAEAQGRFFASGTASPGAKILLYLNNAFVAAMTAGPDSRWSLKIEKGMKPGQYLVRADSVDPTGKVIARAEAPFAYPVADLAVTQVPPSPQPPPLEPAPSAAVKATADAVVKELGTAVVERGDSLWRISRKIYGRGTRYTQIYQANAAQIRNPKLIYPGQIFVVPNSIPN